MRFQAIRFLLVATVADAFVPQASTRPLAPLCAEADPETRVGGNYIQQTIPSVAFGCLLGVSLISPDSAFAAQPKKADAPSPVVNTVESLQASLGQARTKLQATTKRAEQQEKLVQAAQGLDSQNLEAVTKLEKSLSARRESLKEASKQLSKTEKGSGKETKAQAKVASINHDIDVLSKNLQRARDVRKETALKLTQAQTQYQTSRKAQTAAQSIYDSAQSKLKAEETKIAKQRQAAQEKINRQQAEQTRIRKEQQEKEQALRAKETAQREKVYQQKYQKLQKEIKKASKTLEKSQKELKKAKKELKKNPKKGSAKVDSLKSVVEANSQTFKALKATKITK